MMFARVQKIKWIDSSFSYKTKSFRKRNHEMDGKLRRTGRRAWQESLASDIRISGS